MQLTGVGIDRAAGLRRAAWLLSTRSCSFSARRCSAISAISSGAARCCCLRCCALGCDYLIMGFAPVIGWLFIGRVVAGVAGASFTPAYAYVADITEPARARAQKFGLMGAAFGIGFILGPGHRRPARQPGSARAVFCRRRASHSPTPLSATSRCRSHCRRLAARLPLGARQPARHPLADAQLPGRGGAARRGRSCGSSGTRCCRAPGRSTPSPSSTGRAPRWAIRWHGSALVMAIAQGAADAGADSVPRRRAARRPRRHGGRASWLTSATPSRPKAG